MRNNLPQSVQKLIRPLELDGLYVLFEACIKDKKMHKDDKSALLAYIEMRIKKLQKQKDYQDKNINDFDYVSKWGV